MNSVLIIDDDKELCTLMKKCVEQENLSAVVAHGGLEGLRLLEENKDTCSLIILDVMMPDMNGFQVLQEIRKKNNVPVLMLTAKSDEEDKVSGLRLGADDYLTKPFGINELMARVNSLIRRYTTLNPVAGSEAATMLLKDMVIDKVNRTVTLQNLPVELTGKEFDLLVFLASNKGRVFTKKQIYTQVWAEEYAFDDSNIMSFIKDALMDIKSGNLNRRVLVRESDMTKQICYDINEIAMSSQSRLIQQKQSEQAYKRLMTSLSHDVKTPLASLVGYLEAVESKMVTGAEQEEYIRVAAEKAHHLKEFVTVLFEWVKLDAGEQIFHFELCDLNELSRNIMADWVPLLESHDLTYEIEIPETEYMTRVDSTAYTRILNNLLQNILTHSVASQVSLTVTETEQQAKIVVADNGKGISVSDLPHIFERMYQCDHSRAAKGNGLGLSIAKELVSVHKGTITAASIPGAGTTFTIMLPKAL